MIGDWKRKGAFLLAGMLLLGGSLTVCAEEEETPAGYHVYDVQEGEASDTWYGIARGAYLQSGISKVKQGSAGHALASGTTFAQYIDCDRVFVRIYLDKSSSGTGGWGTLDYWTDITYDDAVATTQSGSYKITSNKYYRVRGTHSVTEGSTTETTSTCTNAIKIK